MKSEKTTEEGYADQGSERSPKVSCETHHKEENPEKREDKKPAARLKILIVREQGKGGTTAGRPHKEGASLPLPSEFGKEGKCQSTGGGMRERRETLQEGGDQPGSSENATNNHGGEEGEASH